MYTRPMSDSKCYDDYHIDLNSECHSCTTELNVKNMKLFILFLLFSFFDPICFHFKLTTIYSVKNDYEIILAYSLCDRITEKGKPNESK